MACWYASVSLTCQPLCLFMYPGSQLIHLKGSLSFLGTGELPGAPGTCSRPHSVLVQGWLPRPCELRDVNKAVVLPLSAFRDLQQPLRLKCLQARVRAWLCIKTRNHRARCCAPLWVLTIGSFCRQTPSGSGHCREGPRRCGG